MFKNEHPFFVPKYQRGYAWEAGEVMDFIKDISTLLAEGDLGTDAEPDAIANSIHFMGGVVTVRSTTSGTITRRHDVVDGQQRMATVSLLMERVVQALSEIETATSDATVTKACDTYRDLIRTAFLEYRDAVNYEYVNKPMLTLSRVDKDFFATLLNGNPIPPTRTSHERILAASKLLHDGLVQPILAREETDIGKVNGLYTLYERVATRCVVIHIISQTPAEAYRLFSVLNDRGRNLTDGDLLRAYTLEKLEGHGKEQKDVEFMWDQILDGRHEDVVKFFEAYYPSTKGSRAPRRELFDAYKAAFLSSETPASIVAFVSGLRKEKPVFDLIRAGEWPYANPKATRWDQDRLQRLIGTLRHEAAHPLLLSAATLKEGTFVKIVRLLERFVFRYVTILGAHATPLTGPYYTEAGSMRSKGDKYTLQSLKSALKPLIDTRASDEAFTAGLVALDYEAGNARQREIKHFLSTMESYRRWYERGAKRSKDPVPDTAVHIDLTATTLEHVYPQSPKGTDVNADLEELKHLFPNLALMAGPDNEAIGNADFETKKKEFVKSNIGLTKRLADFTEWTKTEYRERERELTDMALAVFRVG